MALPKNEKITRLEAQLDGLFMFVTSAKELISQGRQLDISDLEYGTNELCRALESLPKRDARPFLARLESLFARIAELEKIIDHQEMAEKENLKFSASHANPLFAQEAGRKDDDDPDRS